MQKEPVWMLLWMPCILQLASAQISGDKVTLHGCIKPKYEYVQKGSNLTLYCTLNETGYIERLGWNLNTGQYISSKINDSSSKISILDLTADTIVVGCSVYLSTRQRIDEVKIQTGDPPETPQNISCIYFHKHNITCSWIHRRDPNIPTTAYLTLPDNTTQNCSAHTESCSFFSGLDLLGLECNITLHLENKLGTATAQFTVNATRIVKMDPPKDLTLLPTKDPSFSISWKRPILSPDELYVKCGLRYRELQDGQWYYIPELQMGIEKEISYILGGLHAHTEYSVSVRCIGSSGQVWWSEWTEEVTGRTEEQAPLDSVELWRVIGTTEGTRLVNLTWKERSGVRSTGITLGYNVLWLPEVRTSDWRNKTTKNNEMTLNITEEAHIISVVHINSAGRSPAAILRIPATWERAREVISSVHISTTASEETTLTWSVIDPRFRRFVLDWCIYSGDGSCNISFQYVENSSQWTIQKGTLELYKRYKISVYPLLEDRAEAPWITYYYIKEGAPLYGPNPKVEDLKETEVTMRWDLLRADESNGFITAFSIVYKPLDGQESVVTVNSDVYEYTLRSLMPDTKYSVYIVANTSGGKTSGNPIHFHTLPESSKYIGVVVGVLGTFLLLVLVLGIVYKHQKEKIKTLVWPIVPDPSYSSISGWPSDWMQVGQFVDPVLTDGTLHSGDLHILHAVYVNDRRHSRELLLPESWGITETSMAESSVQVHYAAADNCSESTTSTLLLQSAASPRAVSACSSPPPPPPSSSSQSAAAKEEPPDLVVFCNEEIAAVHPYLKNSVRTRVVLCL